nr:hypothetical protein Iba_chr15bCG6340 [Ipomoea batatas]
MSCTQQRRNMQQRRGSTHLRSLLTASTCHLLLPIMVHMVFSALEEWFWLPEMEKLCVKTLLTLDWKFCSVKNFQRSASCYLGKLEPVRFEFLVLSFFQFLPSIS